MSAEASGRGKRRSAENAGTIGARIGLARKSSKLTLQQLGSILGVNHTSVWKWEHGKALPELTDLARLADALAVSVDHLLRGEERQPMAKDSQPDVPRMTEATTDTTGLTLLGRPAGLPESPEKAVLERVPNPHPGQRYCVRFTAPEFTSLCPLTGQPDFAHLVIDYVPGDWLVESKSLKLYLSAFRNHGAFHEACTVAIALRLVETIAPAWLRIGGYWYPRGGIPIDVFWQSGDPPAGVWIPDQGVPPYRGRG